MRVLSLKEAGSGVVNVLVRLTQHSRLVTDFFVKFLMQQCLYAPGISENPETEYCQTNSCLFEKDFRRLDARMVALGGPSNYES